MIPLHELLLVERLDRSGNPEGARTPREDLVAKKAVALAPPPIEINRLQGLPIVLDLTFQSFEHLVVTGAGQRPVVGKQGLDS